MARIPAAESFLPLNHVAEILGTSIRVVHELIRAGELDGIQIGGRAEWRVTEGSVRAYIARNDDGPEPIGALV